ncbi:MAG: Ig-like domain-containing protein [Planctomycetota bacterium]
MTLSIAPARLLAAMRWPGLGVLSVLLVSCSRGGSGTFVPGEAGTTSFQIVATNPADGSEDVDSVEPIDIVFSEAVDLRTVNEETILVADEEGPIGGKLAASGPRVRFTASEPLRGFARVEVTLRPGIRSASGHALGAEQRIRFQAIGFGPFEVESVTPRNGTRQVPVDSTVQVRFNRALDGSSVDESSLSVSGPLGPVSGRLLVRGQTLELEPDRDLDLEATYEVHLAEGLAAVDGKTLQEPIDWSFVTVRRTLEEPKVMPPPDAVDIELGTEVLAEFEVDLDPATVHEDSFILLDPRGGRVPAVVTYEERVARLVPTDPLLNRGLYTAKLTTAIQGAEFGQSLPEDVSWQFVTIDYDSFHFNFQSPGVPVPAGDFVDFGEGFGLREGADQGNGLVYGWVKAGTSDPVDKTLDGIDRDINLEDQRLDTLMQMQLGGAAAWEMEVENGFYEVTVCLGDAADAVDSIHRISIEGMVPIPKFQPPPEEDNHAVATLTVWVQDGRLTVDPRGGIRTKINYLDIVPAPFTLNVNFQDSAGEVPLGYLKDYGEPFGLRTKDDQGKGLQYGWVISGTRTPYDRTADGRDRNQNLDDQRLDTLMHMQKASDASFEIALPPDIYVVTVVVGDSEGHTDSFHRIVVEKTVAIEGFTPNPPDEQHLAGTVTVDLIDGFLTIAPTAGSNTKIDYVEIRKE